MSDYPAFQSRLIEDLRAQLAEAERERDEARKLLADRTQQERIGINATPDDGYVQRILEAYIDESYWSDNTAGFPPDSWLCQEINRAQAKRNQLIRQHLAQLAAYRELEEAAREIRREGIDEYWGATYGLEAVMKFDAALAKLEEVRDAPAESHHVKLGLVDYKAKVFVGPDGKLHLETSQDGGKTWETKTLDCPVILEEAPDAQP